MALNSTSAIQIVDLLCEGPIAGIVGGRAGIFLDETPSDSFSVVDVSPDFRNGGRTQSQLGQGRNGTSSITDIGIEIGENYSETLSANNEVVGRNYGAGQAIRQVTDTDAEFIELLLSVPRLFSSAQEGLAKGQLFNGSIRVVVDIQAQGTGYVAQYDRTLTGVSTSDYQIKTPRLPLFGIGPWNVRVRKINLGENHFEVKFFNFRDVAQNIPLASSRGNQLFCTSLIEGQSLRSAYPFCAVAGLSLSTRQFSGLPTRAYKIRGRIVQIPLNAVVRNDGSLSFVGAFNGQLKSAWTTCPVCCWYDMATNGRYGSGDFINAANLSWVDLYPLAQYANQLVTNPDNSQEPRFACNTVIGNRAEAFNVLQDLASVFRGMLFWQANTIQAAADHGNLNGTAIAPVHLYTNSNVIDGTFSYSGTSLKTRSTSIRVRYNDPQNFYKSNFVVVEDATLISKYGYQIKEIVAIGATSKFQAQRLGRWMLASEEIDGEVVSFTTGLQGAVVLPGQVFAVADEMRQGVRLAGRVSSATTSSITTDQTIALPPGSGHTLTCTMPDGAVETRSIASTAGAVINTSSFSNAPLEQSIWSIASSSVQQQKFKCLSVADDGEGQYSITAVEHNDSIYQTADTGTDLVFQDVTLFNDAPAKPINVTIETRQIVNGQTVSNRTLVSWSRGQDGVTFGFELRYKIAGGNYQIIQTSDTSFEIDNLDPGRLLTVQIRSIGAPPVNRKSAWVTATGVVSAPDVDPDNPDTVARPPSPINVTIQATEGDQVVFRWEIPQSVSATSRANLLAVIRHSTQLDGSGEWSNSTLLRIVKAETNSVVMPLMEGEYLIKFQDESGQRSITAVSATIDLPDRLPRLNIDVRREDTDSPPFQGEKVGVFYSSVYDGLIMDGNERIDSKPDFDAIPVFDFFGERLFAGEYFFRNILDFGGVFNAVFTRTLTSRGLYPDQGIDHRTELIDRWSDFDGEIPDDTNAAIYFRTSDQATTDEFFLLEDLDFLLLESGDKIEMESNINFGPWFPMEAGRHTGRQFQFKAEMMTMHPDQTPLIDRLGYTMQLESRTESSATIASGGGLKAVVFDNAFYQEPSLGIIAFNLASGDYYEITAASRSGFTIAFKNGSDALIDRSFQYQAAGYGTEQS